MAGVAHEINNPIGFLKGSINNTKDYVQDLLEHLALYQQHYPHPVAPIQENAADIDLEFTIEDLPNLVDAMQSATQNLRPFIYYETCRQRHGLGIGDRPSNRRRKTRR